MAPPATFDAAIRSAVRLRLQEWVDQENDASLGYEPIAVAWPGLALDGLSSRRRAEVFLDVLEGQPLTTVGTIGGIGGLGQYVAHQVTLRVLLIEPAGDGDGSLQEAAGRLSSYFRGWSYGSPQLEVVTSPETRALPGQDGLLRVQWGVTLAALGAFAQQESA